MLQREYPIKIYIPKRVSNRNLITKWVSNWNLRSKASVQS